MFYETDIDSPGYAAIFDYYPIIYRLRQRIGLDLFVITYIFLRVNGFPSITNHM